MKKITNLRFFIPLVFIATIFLGPVFNFIMFFYRKIPNTYWSFNITPLQFADVMAITIILLSIITLLSYKYVEKISYELSISLSLVIIGFSCIYAAFATMWIIYLITFIAIIVTLGFILPKIIDLIIDTSRVQNIKNFQKYFLPICIIIWLLIHSIIFELNGMQSWRISYLMIGILNIASSPSIFFYEQFE